MSDYKPKVGERARLDIDLSALREFVRETGCYRLTIDVRADGRVEVSVHDALYNVATVHADAHGDCYKPIDWEKLRANCAGRVCK